MTSAAAPTRGSQVVYKSSLDAPDAHQDWEEYRPEPPAWASDLLPTLVPVTLNRHCQAHHIEGTLHRWQTPDNKAAGTGNSPTCFTTVEAVELADLKPRLHDQLALLNLISQL